LEDVLRQDQGKAGRADCLYHSEKVLRAGREEETNECAKAYRGFLATLKDQYLVSFIPDRCTGNICQGVLDHEKVPGGHVFMQTDGTFLGTEHSTQEAIWQLWGVLYRKE
jgi:hypothetical protein